MFDRHADREREQSDERSDERPARAAAFHQLQRAAPRLHARGGRSALSASLLQDRGDR